MKNDQWTFLLTNFSEEIFPISWVKLIVASNNLTFLGGKKLMVQKCSGDPITPLSLIKLEEINNSTGLNQKISKHASVHGMHIQYEHLRQWLFTHDLLINTSVGLYSRTIYQIPLAVWMSVCLTTTTSWHLQNYIKYSVPLAV